MPEQRIMEIVRPLTIQLKEARKFAAKCKRNVDNLIEDIKGEICFVANIFQRLEKWEKDMKDKFGDIVKELNEALEHSNDEIKFRSKLQSVGNTTSGFKRSMIKGSPLLLERLEAYVKSVSYEIPLLDISSQQTSTDSAKPLELHFDRLKSLSEIEENIKTLHTYNMQILVFLSIFPPGSLIKKTMIYYWWIGAHSHSQEDEELQLNSILEELAHCGLIRNIYKNYKQNVIDCCIINPLVPQALINLNEHPTVGRYINTIYDPLSIRPFLSTSSTAPNHMMRLFSEQNDPFGNTCFNIKRNYLKFERKNIEYMKESAVLMLGRWHNSVKHHIEVENTEFLKWLGSFNSLRYLSLRGISRIIELPREIGELKSLCVLNLRASYDLQRLPIEITKLRRLEHLDTSECYFLSHIPQGISLLLCLKVLKGFVVGNLQTQESCRLGELSKLNFLKKLSINIGRGYVLEEGEFGKLSGLTSLVSLTITWSTSQPPSRNGDSTLLRVLTTDEIDVSPPPNLEKVDLRCIPERTPPRWLLPSKLTKLERLYIIGGKLSVHTLRDLRLTWPGVKVLRVRFFEGEDTEDYIDPFPNLDYVEYHKHDKSEISFHLKRNAIEESIEEFRQRREKGNLDREVPWDDLYGFNS